MFQRVSILTMLLLAGLAPASLAQIIVDPDPPHGTLGINLPAGTIRNYIPIEGRGLTGLPDDCGDGRCADYTIEIMGFDNTPLVGGQAMIDFSACVAAGDIQLACDQSSGIPGQMFVAPAAVGGTTDAAGRFTFRVIGSAKSSTLTLPGNDQTPGSEMGAATPCAKVYVDGVLFGALRAVAFDIDGAGSPTTAVSASDIATVAAENTRGALTGIRHARTDIDRNGAVGASDIVRMANMSIDASLGRGSNATGPYCP